jgi:glycosyltransferase involved in cell wall biosynthesis
MDANLTLVMPAFNEAKTIEETIKKVVSLNFVNQLVVVDDGSTDGTREILKNLNNEKLKIIFHEMNQGKGAALHTGFKEAKGPFVGVQDADLEYDPNDLSKFLEEKYGEEIKEFAENFYSPSGNKLGNIYTFWKQINYHFGFNTLETISLIDYPMG